MGNKVPRSNIDCAMYSHVGHNCSRSSEGHTTYHSIHLLLYQLLPFQSTKVIQNNKLTNLCQVFQCIYSQFCFLQINTSLLNQMKTKTKNFCTSSDTLGTLSSSSLVQQGSRQFPSTAFPRAHAWPQEPRNVAVP